MDFLKHQANTQSVKITLEISQDTNLAELMNQLSLMQNSMPAESPANRHSLPDFSIHEGELEPADSFYQARA